MRTTTRAALLSMALALMASGAAWADAVTDNAQALPLVDAEGDAFDGFHLFVRGVERYGKIGDFEDAVGHVARRLAAKP